MTVVQVHADTEDGDHVADPSETDLVALITGLNADNTFVTLTPDDDGAPWHASVVRLGDGSYEVERNDADHDIDERVIATDITQIAKDLAAWLTER
jgi:hypothetical protein